MTDPGAALSIRRARVGDSEPIREIYNEAVATTAATFDTEPRTPDAQARWLAEHCRPYGILVAERAGRIEGWASLSRWSERRAYAATAEDSVYVRSACRGAGVGRRLLTRLVDEGARSGFHTLLARIADGNAPSRHLHTELGFERVGVMREVGEKFGRRIDVELFQRVYADRPPRQS